MALNRIPATRTIGSVADWSASTLILAAGEVGVETQADGTQIEFVGDGTNLRANLGGQSNAIKTGTAVLVAGTIVIADVKITANSIIRLSRKTVGGTPGALFNSAKTASTSFAVTSTSATDTSTIYYEILAY